MMAKLHGHPAGSTQLSRVVPTNSPHPGGTTFTRMILLNTQKALLSVLVSWDTLENFGQDTCPVYKWLASLRREHSTHFVLIAYQPGQLRSGM